MGLKVGFGADLDLGAMRLGFFFVGGGRAMTQDGSGSKVASGSRW